MLNPGLDVRRIQSAKDREAAWGDFCRKGIGAKDVERAFRDIATRSPIAARILMLALLLRLCA